MTPMPAAAVFAVVVAYRPERPTLQRLVDILGRQVAGLVVVDNGSGGVVEQVLAGFPPGFAVRLDPGENIGVAEGLNRGVDCVVARGATHVLLSDQDSEPPETMVATLLADLGELEARQTRVAAIGPRYVDPRCGYASPFMRTIGLRHRVVPTQAGGPPVEVDFVITSGALIPVSSWQAVGPMEGPLFIDYVDIEWGLRARAKSYASYGSCRVDMAHCLGDSRMEFRGRFVPIHSPLRHYYQIRNPLWLFRQSWIPLNWKIVDGIRLMYRFLFYTVYVAPRLTNFRFMLRGLIHGLMGRLGRYDTPRR